ncbi:integrase core domain-containing protein [Frankia sp. Cr2]|uniref:integrase core domain-containing protein n=1 Tax=Frankia sp. Cr2 TaxID=3073932 RepID=UPI002AD2BD4A|nr:integrase core domain-containing protein [Frankia sp. Cr2]
MLSKRHATTVLTDYGDEYNNHRPHRSLRQQTPLSAGIGPLPEPGTSAIRDD